MRIKAATPTITNPTDTLPIYSTHGTLEDETGSLVIAKGAKAYGTMPTNSSKFRGHKDAFLLIPDWQSGESYPSYARVHIQTEGKNIRQTQQHQEVGI